MSDLVKKLVADDRTTVRVPIPGGVEAWVEIRLEDRHWRRPLLDICEIGISFEGSGGLPEMAPGSTFVDTLVRVGDCEIHGTMVVCHVTPSMATGKIHGARFRPRSQEDRTRLRELVERFWTGLSKTDAEPFGMDLPPIPAPSDAAETRDGATVSSSLRCRHCLGSLEQDELIDGSTCPYCLQKLGF